RQGELRYQKEAPADVDQGPIHPPLLIGKDPVRKESLEETVRRGFIVTSTDPHQREDSCGNGTHEIAIDMDCRLGDTLDEADHGWRSTLPLRTAASCPKAAYGICRGESVRFGAVLLGWSE